MDTPIVHVLTHHGAMPAEQLAIECGMSDADVTRALAELVAAGRVVFEDGMYEPDREGWRSCFDVIGDPVSSPPLAETPPAPTSDDPSPVGE